MSINQWVYEKATGKWMVHFRDPSIFNSDPINYGIVDLGDGQPFPDPITERFDAVNGRRAATPTEIAESQADQQGVEVTRKLDQERLISSVVWAIIDQFAAPATVAKYQAARTNIIAAYKSKPWVP